MQSQFLPFASTHEKHLHKIASNPNSVEYNPVVANGTWNFVTEPPSMKTAGITPTIGYADQLKQGYEWNPLLHKQVNGADCVSERIEWKKKFCDPRKKWHVREALTKNAIATNRIRLGPNTRVIECGAGTNCPPQLSGPSNVDSSYSYSSNIPDFMLQPRPKNY